VDFGFIHGDIAPPKEGEPLPFPYGVSLMFKFMRAPNQVTLVNGNKFGNRPVASLRACIQWLAANVTAANFRNLLLGSHATDATLQMPMFNTQGAQTTTYETLEKTQVESDKSIVIPPALISNPPTHSVRIVGCNIGKSKKFLEQLKKALGNNVKVIAPKHFDGISKGDGYGVWEYLAYEFMVSLPKPTKFHTLKQPHTMAQIMAEFQSRAAGTPGQEPPFQFINGSKVPDAYWTNPAWYAPIPMTKVSLPLASPIGPANTVLVHRGLEIKPGSINWPVLVPNSTPFPNLKDEPTCLALLKAAWLEDKGFARSRFVGGPTGHEFPVFTRYNFQDIDKMLKGYLWTFTKEASGSQSILRCVGERFTYKLVVPITNPSPSPDPKVGRVLTNFHPDPVLFKKVPFDQLPPPGLSLNNLALYETV
jgi:hypothetical protein